MRGFLSINQNKLSQNLCGFIQLLTNIALKPTLFIGSSTESLEVAYTVQEELEFDAEVTVWTQGIFNASQSAIDDLIASISRFDFALFIFSPDDELKHRSITTLTVRDNVLFELGLFMGRIGRERVLFIVSKEVELHIASDLLGITPLIYSVNRSDDNIRAALGPACNKIRRILKTHDQLPRGPIDSAPSKPQMRAGSNHSTKKQIEVANVINYISNIYGKGGSFVVFADLDGFTGMAKWYGIEVADKIIEKVTNIVKQTADKHSCYWSRLGGDEYLLFIESSIRSPFTEEQAKCIATALVTEVALHNWADLVPNLYVSISVGIAPAKLDNEVVQEWIIRAINGAIAAKKQGGNRVHIAPIALPRGSSKLIQDHLSI